VEKLKLKQNQTSQQPEPIKKESPKEIEGLDLDEVEEVEEVEEVKPVKAKNPVEKQADESEDESEDLVRNQVLMEIEMLQNNGRFRVELLHQLQELNKALVLIASALVNDK